MKAVSEHKKQKKTPPHRPPFSRAEAPRRRKRRFAPSHDPLAAPLLPHAKMDTQPDAPYSKAICMECGAPPALLTDDAFAQPLSVRRVARPYARRTPPRIDQPGQTPSARSCSQATDSTAASQALDDTFMDTSIDDAPAPIHKTLQLPTALTLARPCRLLLPHRPRRPPARSSVAPA